MIKRQLLSHVNLFLSLSLTNTINITNSLPHLPISLHIYTTYQESLFFFFIMGEYHNNVNLPPGFRFCPTDEELVVHFLQRKASLLPYHPNIIPDLHLYPYDPWDLDGKAMAEGNKWYFYSRRTQNRITSNGYWNPFGGDEPIFSSNTSKRVGTKKYYMFYMGEPSQGIKTNWIMEEYGLSDGSSSSRSSKRRQSNLDYSKWVVCRVYDHNYDHDDDDDDGRELSCLDEVFLSLEDDFDEISFPN